MKLDPRKTRNSNPTFGGSKASVVREAATLLAAALAALVALVLLPPTRAHAQMPDPALDVPMDNDPRLEEAVSRVVFSPRQRELWLAALGRPDADTRRQAADAMGNAALAGISETDAFVEPLRDTLKNDQRPIVRLAVVRALIRLQAKVAAPDLLKAGADGLEMTLLVDPALAAWDVQAARQEWIRRVSEAAADRSARLSAIDALARVREPAAQESLLTLATDRAADVTLRLAAGRALGAVAGSGLLDPAQQLLTAPPSETKAGSEATRADGGATLVDRLVAASMLASHSGPEAEAILIKLAGDPEPAVAAVALRRLVAIAPARVAGMSPSLLAGQGVGVDPNVRHLVAQALAIQHSPDSVAALARLLDDSSELVRRYARQALLDEAKDPKLADAVRQGGMEALAGKGWRGLEQASTLLGLLDHKPAGDRLVELMRHSRAEVRLAAIVGLRRLGVPQTLPAVLKRLEELSQSKDRSQTAENETIQLCHALGLHRYQEADGLLQEYIPKTAPYGTESRCAAIWALGFLHEGQGDTAPASALAGRLGDLSTLEPEAPKVRRMAATSLGRMKAKGSLSMLDRFYKEEMGSGDVGGSCRWAIMQITGRDLPLPNLVGHRTSSSFLDPIK